MTLRKPTEVLGLRRRTCFVLKRHLACFAPARRRAYLPSVAGKLLTVQPSPAPTEFRRKKTDVSSRSKREDGRSLTVSREAPFRFAVLSTAPRRPDPVAPFALRPAVVCLDNPRENTRARPYGLRCLHRDPRRNADGVCQMLYRHGWSVTL